MMFFSRACPVHRNLLTRDMFQGSRAQELPKKQTIIVTWMEFFGLSIFMQQNGTWSHFLGQPKWHFVCASSRAMVKNGANTKKTQKSHCKAQKGYSWCMFRLGVFEHLEFWALGYTIFGEMSSRKSGDGHVNLTVSCHIKRQLSGTCHVLFLLPGTGIQ